MLNINCPLVNYYRSSMGMYQGAPVSETMPASYGMPVTALPYQSALPFAQQPGINVPFDVYMTDDIYGTGEMDEGPAVASPGDPPPILSNNPVTTTIVLFKELTAYPNYGNPSGNADILYTGNRGTWTFELPSTLYIPGNFRMQIVIRAVLDDHAAVPLNQYSARITVNGTNVHTGPVPLEHGVPVGARFTNWRQLTFNVPVLRRINRVVIVNTSTAGQNDWMAFDWMEMRFAPR